ncbi:MAG: type II toxin-antitoxin system Phd/YefM family antitoxin [Candidatus Schekmanbacteria bacterium]|nr:type II toxin-antitoxin system Phd/YefM family antitoxin [Candidatus Schekmanbacteria bacterium]
MRIVGIKILKNNLSEYVRLASQGETVLISDRDRVVAELVPPQACRAERVSDAVLVDLVRHGMLTPPLLPPSQPPRARVVAPLAQLLGELDEDRSR